MFVIFEIIGNFLLFCMIIYEKYGMDSQKRTVTNQLLSSILFGAGVYSPVPYPALTLGVSGKCPIEGDEVYSLSGEYLYILLFGAEGWEVRHDHPVYSLLHSQ